MKKLEVPTCYRCGQKDGVLLRWRKYNNGAKSVFWKCENCNAGAERNSPSIRHEIVKTALGSKITLFWEKAQDADYSTECCCVCGAMGTELHHFAPRALERNGEFWHSEDWPMAYLCAEHHRLWHSLMTPWIESYSKNPEAQYIIQKIRDMK